MDVLDRYLTTNTDNVRMVVVGNHSKDWNKMLNTFDDFPSPFNTIDGVVVRVPLTPEELTGIRALTVQWALLPLSGVGSGNRQHSYSIMDLYTVRNASSRATTPRNAAMIKVNGVKISPIGVDPMGTTILFHHKGHHGPSVKVRRKGRWFFRRNG